MMSDESVKPDEVIDARGLYCPGPLMELIRVISVKPVGAVLKILSSDEGSAKDIPAWISKVGQQYIGTEKVDGYWELLVKKVK